MEIRREEQLSMADTEFAGLLTSEEAKNLKGNELLSYSKRDIEICSTSARSKVRDYLHSHDVACGKVSGQPIVDYLLNLYPPPSASTVSRMHTQVGASSSTNPSHQNIYLDSTA